MVSIGRGTVLYCLANSLEVPSRILEVENNRPFDNGRFEIRSSHYILFLFGSAISVSALGRGLQYLAWGFAPVRADGLSLGIALAFFANLGWLQNSRIVRYRTAVAWFSVIALLAMLTCVDGGTDDVFLGLYFFASLTTAVFIAGLVSAPPPALKGLLSWNPLE
jgi:peptidoglycan/LPS O-acetylase OafA/YrhL